MPTTPKTTVETWTIASVLNWTTNFFQRTEIEDARLNAELLLSHALGTTRIALYTDYARELPPDVLRNYRELIMKRASHVPVQYLVGKVSFLRSELVVREGVFIPRPETELLVKLLLDNVRAGRVADIGTGSGNIAVSAALANPNLEVVAADISETALEVARENIERHSLGNRVRVVRSDLFESLEGTFDAVVSNPPYVSAAELERCQPEVREHEPREALYGGTDGLDVIRRLVRSAPAVLAPGGTLIVEIGAGQANAAAELARESFQRVVVHKDFNGIDRALVAQRT